MELRLLRYFLTVAKEQSFTKAAEQLHITQPTLSRQMAALEDELGITLFLRNGKRISLTDEGILLKRRALEILNLEEKTLEELKGKEDVVEGTITIGCGEFAAVEILARICKTYKEKYPLIQIALHTATADTVYEMMKKGLVDIALFLEPVDTEGLDYIRITDCDHWCVGMRPNDPLAEKELIKKEDLKCRSHGGKWIGVSNINRRCRKVLERGHSCTAKNFSRNHDKYCHCLEAKHPVFFGGQ